MFSSKGGKGWTYLHDERETKPNLPVKMAADFQENAGRKHDFNCNFFYDYEAYTEDIISDVIHLKRSLL